jgi:hypothetical protein
MLADILVNDLKMSEVSTKTINRLWWNKFQDRKHHNTMKLR